MVIRPLLRCPVWARQSKEMCSGFGHHARNAGEALRVTREEWRRSLTDVLRESFALHFERNGFYRAQCDAAGLIPSGIRDGADLHRIPLLPVSMFKQAGAHVLMTCGLEDVEIEIRSTGTSGVPSVARRDSTTVTRASVGIFGGYRDFLGISQGAGYSCARRRPRCRRWAW